MATRRSSSTSLSLYPRAQSRDEELGNRSLDFCNAFWGIADGGYDVLLARIRGAVKTTEELRSFWKERAAIEDDYAKRLTRLARQALGKDELGELRNSLDMLRAETDRQGTAHANLSQTMRKELEGPLAELLNKQSHFKRNTLASVEKSYKTKQTQETYVKRSRQKYEEDCVRINSYTAQSTLVQGKELERIQTKLDKTRQTVQANEREYAQYARALADTTSRWEKEWKVFCDTCQDMEEDRIEFMKDNVWAYANAVSTVCVADDESCEKIRVSLELVEAEKEIEAFTQDYTTGPQIPDPPPFIDYNSPNAAQQQSRQTYRIANFARSSNRMAGVSFVQSPMSEDEPTSAGQAGRGAVGTRVEPATSRPTSAAAMRAVPSATNGASSSSSTPSQPGLPPSTNALQAAAPKPPVIQAATAAKSTAAPPSRPRAQDPLAEPIDHRAETVLKIGPNMYPVNINEDPQQARVNVNTAPVTNIDDHDDPLVKKMVELRSASVRKGSENRRSTLETHQQFAPGPASTTQSAPSNGPAAPTAYNAGRAPSPAPAASPTANFMIPPSSRSTSPLPVEDIVSNYPQRLPGETSHRNSMNRGRQPAPQAQGGVPPRGVSPGKEGYAGAGAHGGSRSPSPLPISRSASPAMLPSQNHLGYNQQAPSQAPSQAPVRAPSPLGIELDPNGQVAHDELAERMYRQQQPQGNHYQHSQGSYDSYGARPGNAGNYGSAGNQRQYQQTPAQQQQPYYQTQRANNVGPVYPQQPARMGTVPPSNTFQAPPPVQQPAQQHPGYGYDQRQQHPSHGGYPNASNNGYQTNRDYNNSYVQQQQGGYRSPSPMLNRSPSPAPAPSSNAPPPTGQYTESGEPVLFYVKALYDYQATIDEEFDFQAEDIIAVTATPEDGWWSGELLDERRRVPGRTIFPSNFVALLN